MRFNAKNSSSRSLEQIKIKYDNLIRKAWKVAASNNKYLVGTGDGPSQEPMSDPVLINKYCPQNCQCQNDRWVRKPM